MADGPNEATSPDEILACILNPNEAKTETEWACADEIARLKAEVARMREALEEIVKPGGADDFWQCYDIARAALNPSQAPRT